jgi:hypothetical protein
MTIEPLTFYKYITNHDTINTNMYKTYLPDCIDILPERICGSRVINRILSDKLDQYFKKRIFNDCFLEYVAYKLRGDSRPHNPW